MITVHPDIIAEVEQFAAQNPTMRVSLLTADGYICYRSAQTVAASPYAAEDVIGRHISEFIHSRDHDHIKLVFGDALLNDESIEAGVQLTLPDGLTKLVRSKAYRLNDPATGEAFVMSCTLPVQNDTDWPRAHRG